MPQDRIVTVEERESSRLLPAYSLHLDLIRGLAALVVFYGHLHQIVAGHGSVVNVGNDGAEAHGLSIATHPAYATALPHAAVVIFFVLSGYLVGGSVLRDLKRDAFSWSSYAVRRLCRLWTVLVPTLILGSIMDAASRYFFGARHLPIVGPLIDQLHGLPSLLNFVRYLFFFQTIDRFPSPRFGTNGPLWSLASEFWFYVLFPLVAICLISTRASRTVRAVFALLAVAILWFVGARIGLGFPIWLLGVVAYVLPAKIPASVQRRVNLILVSQFCLVLYFLRSHAIDPLWADFLLALSFTLLLYGILHRIKPEKKSLYSHFVHGISFPSYTLYALHVPIVILFAAFLEAEFPNLFRHTGIAIFILAGPVLVCIGLVYFLFERNTDKFRRLVERRLSWNQPRIRG